MARLTQTEDAVRAAASVARAHGLDVGGARLLAVHSSVLVRLDPAPVVARVAIAELPRFTADWAERELAVSAYLAEAGAPVAAPSRLLPPGPHPAGPFAITFWTLVDDDPERPLDAVAAGRGLAEIHAALRGYPGELPEFYAPAEARKLLAEVRLEEADRRRLAHALAEAEEGVAGVGAPAQGVHGDAHLGNVLRSSHGPVWCDLEDCCRAPREWDLACLVSPTLFWGPNPDVDAALAAYGPYDAGVLAPFLQMRAVFVTLWDLLSDAVRPERSRSTERRLAFWRERYAREM